MENAYGIGITNRFGCFLRRASSDSEDETEEVLMKSSDVAPKPKPKIAEKENQKVDGSAKLDKTNAAARKGIRDSNQKGNDAAKGQTGGVGNRTITANNDGGQQKQNRPPRTDRPPFDKERGMKFSEDDREERNNRRNRDDGSRGDAGDFGDRRGRGGGGGGGFRGERRGSGPRGGGGGGGMSRGGPRKREFDRQSGSDKSGVKSVDKREGGGSRNWGTYKDEIEPETTLNTTVGEEPTDDKIEKDHTDEKKEEKTEGEEAVENGPAEPKLMTLEEWKAAQQPRQKPVFNLRKAGEGEDQAQWQNLTLKKKEKVVDQEEEEVEDEEEYDCPQRAGRQKQVLEIDFHFADSRRGGPSGERRGTGGRGRSSTGDRGSGMDRGGDRGERGGDRTGDRGERGGDRGGDRDRGERGGRGAPRGGGGFRGGRDSGEGGGFRGGFRGGRGGRDDRPTRQAAPRVDDVNDFPSLD